MLKEKPLGNDLLSREVALQVPSALACLTTGFGMGPGVPTSHKSPRDVFTTLILNSMLNGVEVWEKYQVLRTTGLSPRPLVQFSLTHYCAYTYCLYSR